MFTLPKADQDLLSSLGYKEKLERADAAILENAEFLKQIVANPEIFGIGLDSELDESEEHGEQEPSGSSLEGTAHADARRTPYPRLDGLRQTATRTTTRIHTPMTTARTRSRTPLPVARRGASEGATSRQSSTWTS